MPSYDELVLVVREDEAHTRGQDLRAFLQALTPGRARGARRPGRRGRAAWSRPTPRSNRKLQLASIEQTLPAALPADHGKPFGWQDPTAVGGFRELDVRAQAARSTTRAPGCRRSPTSSCPGRGSSPSAASGRSSERRSVGSADASMARIGLLTGGGDCPGLNAVIRAVVRRGLAEGGHSFVGFRYGWAGVLADDAIELTRAEHRRHPPARRHDPRHLAHQPVRRRRRMARRPSATR